MSADRSRDFVSVAPPPQERLDMTALYHAFNVCEVSGHERQAAWSPWYTHQTWITRLLESVQRSATCLHVSLLKCIIIGVRVRGGLGFRVNKLT